MNDVPARLQSPRRRHGRADFDRGLQKVRLITARVLAAERVPSQQLLKLRVDIGTEERQLVAGIAAKYEPGARPDATSSSSPT